MARIAGIHGIGQQLKGPHTLRDEWLPGLRDGLHAAGVSIDPDDLECAFYGDLFRKAGKATGGAVTDVADLDPEFEVPLLLALADATDADAATVPRTKARTPTTVQKALSVLSRAPFCVGLTEPLLLGNLRQVRRYMTEPDVREAITDRVMDVIKPDTQVIIGHSLGSVIAYEVLAAYVHPQPCSLVTLGSPLGIRNLIFDRLRPSPVAGRGTWPGHVRYWGNVADRGDVVALAKQLRPLFDGQVADHLVHNGATAHDVKPYLTAPETGAVLANALRHAS